MKNKIKEDLGKSTETETLTLMDAQLLSALRLWSDMQARGRIILHGNHSDGFSIRLPAPDFKQIKTVEKEEYNDSEGYQAHYEIREEYPVPPLQFRMALHSLLEKQGFITPTFYAEVERDGVLQQEKIPAAATPLMESRWEGIRIYDNGSMTTYRPVIYPDTPFFQERDPGKKYAHVRFYEPSHHERLMGEYADPTIEFFTGHTHGIDFTRMLFSYCVENFSAALTRDIELGKEMLDAMRPFYGSKIASGIDFDKINRDYLRAWVEHSVKNLHIEQKSPRKNNFAMRILQKYNEQDFGTQVCQAEMQIDILQKVEPFFADFYTQLKTVHGQAVSNGLSTVTDAIIVSVATLGEADAYALYTNLMEALKETGITGIGFDYNQERKEIICNITEAAVDSIAPKGELQEQFYGCIIENTNKRGHFASNVLRPEIPVHLQLFFEDFYKQLGDVYDAAAEQQQEKVTARFSVDVKSLSTEVAKGVVSKLNTAQEKTKISNIAFSLNEKDKTIECRISNAPREDIAPRGDLKDATARLLQGMNGVSVH